MCPPDANALGQLDQRGNDRDRDSHHPAELDDEAIFQLANLGLQGQLQRLQIGLGRQLGLNVSGAKRLGDRLGLALGDAGLLERADESMGVEGDGGHARPLSVSSDG